jgi:GAF domain-containing protein
MARDLQAIVDSLGQRVRRAVALDDPQLRLLAYTSHFGSVDPVRTASILHRRAPAKATTWVFGQGIRSAAGPVRVPANAQLEMGSRVCAPVRFQGELLGFLWLIDADESLTDRDFEVIQAAADAAAAVLQLERSLGELERSRERELLRDLLSDQPNVRHHAATELVESNLVIPTRGVVALVVQPPMSEPTATASERSAIRSALERVRRTLSPRHALHLDRPDHGLLAVAMEDAMLRVGGVEALAKRLVEAVEAKLRTAQGQVVVGIGETQADLADLSASYEQARQATRVAQIVPAFSPVAVWSALGIYRALLQFPLDHLKANVLHPGLIALLRDSAHDDLVGTLERFLDLAGSAKRTAADLNLHRATLYYRLRRIEQIVGVDLEDGNDRLALHLSLKLARLAGIIAEVGRAPAQPQNGHPRSAASKAGRVRVRETATGAPNS